MHTLDVSWMDRLSPLGLFEKYGQSGSSQELESTQQVKQGKFNVKNY